MECDYSEGILVYTPLHPLVLSCYGIDHNNWYKGWRPQEVGVFFLKKKIKTHLLRNSHSPLIEKTGC